MNFHVTLKFIGQTDDAGFLRIDDVLKTACRTEAPMRLKIEGVGTFGDPRHVRALWAGVVPSPPLMDLQRRVETVLAEKAGFPPEGRPFLPHVTLAKPKTTRAELIRDYLEKHAGFVLPDFIAREAILFSSHTGSKGAEYRVEKTYALMECEPTTGA